MNILSNKKQPTQPLRLFATAPKGLELLLVDELRALGATSAAEKLAGVSFEGDWQLAYKACLWSRLASRILLPLHAFPAATPQDLYDGVKTILWESHIAADGTLAVHAVCSQSLITHSLFAAQKVKDAIVDRLRDQFGVRPSVQRTQPDISIYLYLHRDQATIYLDLSGDSLHRRGYRLDSGQAPLKENLAAAILLRANWPSIAKEKGTLLDPMCGSGTLLIEGAWMAADIAPGLHRQYFGFLGWKQHQPALWEALLKEAKARAAAGLARLPTIVGYDQNPDAIKIAFANIERAGMQGKIHVEKRALEQFAPRATMSKGLVVTNPPYGERLGEVDALQSLYTQLGDCLKQHFENWQAAVFTGNPELGKQMGIRAKHYYALYNGALPCRLLLFDVVPQFFVDRSDAANNERRVRAAQRSVQHQAEGQQDIQMFINRLRKNLKHLKREAKRLNKTTYRVYDADLPEFAFAIDLTEDGAQVFEYEAPRGVDKEKALRRQQAVLAVLPDLLALTAAQIAFKVIPRIKK